MLGKVGAASGVCQALGCNGLFPGDKMAAQGLGADSEQHTGPMAQDVNATMGNKAAPGGKKIDLITLNGKTMLAVQALDRKVNMLAKMLQGGQLQVGAAA